MAFMIARSEYVCRFGRKSQAVDGGDLLYCAKRFQPMPSFGCCLSALSMAGYYSFSFAPPTSQIFSYNIKYSLVVWISSILRIYWMLVLRMFLRYLY